jgi:hypothetical protein
MAILRCAFESSTASGVEIVNTLHVDDSQNVDPTVEQLEAIRNAVRDALLDTYVIMLAASSTLHQIRVSTEKDPLDPTDVSIGTLIALEQSGGGGTPSDFAPHELGVVLSLRTALLGRSFRGHMSVPPLSNAADIDGEQVSETSTYYGAVLGFRAALLTMVAGGSAWADVTANGEPYEGLDPRLIVYSRTRRARSFGDYSNDVTSIGFSRRLHWLRSRAR